MVDNVRKWLTDLSGRFRRVEAPPVGPRRVTALEIRSAADWRYVSGEIETDRLTVMAAGRVGDGPAPEALTQGAAVVLVVNSERSVCRMLDVVGASPEQTRNMVALRLETELPYPVADAVWVCDRPAATNGNGTHVLVVAVPEADVAAAQQALRARGVSCGAMEYDAAALSELARSDSPGRDLIAVTRIETRNALLSLVQNELPCYVRRVANPGTANEVMGQNGWTSRVTGELIQSLYEHRMRTEAGAPTRLLVTGEAAGNDDVLAALAKQMGIPVQAATLPDFVSIAADASVDGDLVVDYPACMGVLISAYRRHRGERAAAPPLRDAQHAEVTGEVRNRRAVLALATVVLFALLAVSLLGVRSARLHAIEGALKEIKPFASDLARLQDEVDTLQFESKRQRSSLDVLGTLAKVLPSELTVETIALSPEGKLSIKGRTSSVTAASDKAIAAMNDSGMFTKCAFLGATEEKGAFVFQLSCELARTQGKASR